MKRSNSKATNLRESNQGSHSAVSDKPRLYLKKWHFLTKKKEMLLYKIHIGVIAQVEMMIKILI